MYTARRPFHPQRLMDILGKEFFPGVIRSKGYVWLSSRHNSASLWSQAGPVISIAYAGTWWSTVSKEEWPDDPAIRQEIEALIEPEYGDRRQELVFIGIDMNRHHICSQLDAALLTALPHGRILPGKGTCLMDNLTLSRWNSSMDLFGEIS